MAHAQTVKIESIYLKRLILNIYPNAELKVLYSHAKDTLKQLTKACIEIPPGQGDRYHGFYGFLEGNGTCGSLQFDPLITSNAPFRLTIKPSIGGKEAHKRICRVLVEVFGLEYERHMVTAKIAGFELAIGVSGTALDDLLLFDSAKRVSSRHYDERGHVSSIHLGSETSDQQIVIANIAEPEPPQRLIQRHPAIFNKVEIVAKVTAENVPIQDTTGITNPLAFLSVMRLPRTFPETGSAAWLGFMDSCRLRGMQAALPRLPKPELRRKFRSRIGQRLVANWWHPSAIWSRFPDLVSELGFPKKLPTTEVNTPHNTTKQERHYLDEEDDE